MTVPKKMTGIMKMCDELHTCLAHVEVNTAPWTSAAAAHMDATLNSLNSTALRVHCADLPLEDGEHFTWRGYCEFCKRFATATQHIAPAGGTLRVYADSTIDYHNWDDDYETRHGAADTYLHRTFGERGRCISIDAVCGSGFVALSPRQHLATRVSRDRRAGVIGPRDVVVLIGGWNDTAHDPRAVQHAIRGCARQTRLTRHVE